MRYILYGLIGAAIGLGAGFYVSEAYPAEVLTKRADASRVMQQGLMPVAHAPKKTHTSEELHAIIAAASQAGALYYCDQNGLYANKIYETGRTRLELIVLASEDHVDLSELIQQVATIEAAVGRYATVITRADGTPGFKRTASAVADQAACLVVEALLKESMKEDGVLDVDSGQGAEGGKYVVPKT